MPIGPTEYRLLHFFMTHPERVYTRAQLLDHVWGGSVYVEERTIDVHIRRLRKTLEPFNAENMVQTVRRRLLHCHLSLVVPAPSTCGAGAGNSAITLGSPQ